MTLPLECILCFYCFVYAQFFGMSEVLGMHDSMLVVSPKSVSILVTQITFLQDGICGPLFSELCLR